MHLIKVLLLLSFVALLVYGFRQRRRVGLRAGTRVMVLLLATFAVASVIDTGIPQRLASAVGVTRGTDLVLYVLVVVFVLTSTGLYFRARRIEDRLADLVRSVALAEALRSGGPGGAPSGGRPDAEVHG